MNIVNGYDLRPHKYVLIELNEKINMPNNLCAFIRPRTTLTKLGLQITSQFVNPTYQGRLRIGLYNASPFIFELVPKIIIGQIIFEEFSGIPDDRKLYANKENSKYQNEDIIYVPSKIHEEIDPHFKALYDSLIQKIRERGGLFSEGCLQ